MVFFYKVHDFNSLTRIGIIGVLFLLIYSDQSSANVPDVPDNENILVVFSMQPATPAYRIILDEIRNQLDEEFGYNYNMYTEYMEMDRFPQWSLRKENIDLLNKKYEEIDLDLLICVGINLVETLKQEGKSYLLDLPTVSLDLDFSNYGIEWEKKLNDKTVAIPLKLEAGKSIAAIFDLIPDVKSVWFICGSSTGDQVFYTVAKKEAAKLKPGVKVNFIVGVKMNEVLKAVGHLDDGSIIIVPRYTNDSTKVTFYNSESVRLICKAANAPVFTFTSMGFGEGVVGGYILSFDKAGRIAGEAAVKLLKGADPNSISYAEKEYYEYVFDWRALQKWQLDVSKSIPARSTIKFRDISFIDKYKWVIAGGITFIILQTLLIISLVRLNKKQKMMTLQVREAENKFRQLVREDRILQIGQLTASLSHELSQPLTAILSTAQAGLRFIDSGNYTPEMLKEILQDIVENDKRTASILNSVRGMIKLEKADKERVNLHSVICDVLYMIRGESVAHKVELVVEQPAGPFYVFADATQIQQVILNLIFNAMQSVETSNAMNRVISITELEQDDHVTVSVRDFGDGIHKSIIDKLFKPFVTSKKDGLGIGLSISQSIIQDHQGKIWAENRSDGGAEFSFSLKKFKDEG